MPGKKRVLDFFEDSVHIKNYTFACINVDNPKIFVKTLFEKEFQRYLKRSSTQLMVLKEENSVYYRRFPKGMEENEYTHLQNFNSREILDKYILLVIKPVDYNSISVKSLDTLIERILCKIADSKGVEIESNCLRNRKNRKVAETNLELSKDLHRRLQFYVEETQKERIESDLVRKISRQIVVELADQYERARRRGLFVPTSVKELLDKDESSNIEFKSSMCWDYAAGKKSDIPELAIAKAVSCLMNSEGGWILVGIDDNKNVLGLEKDFQVIRKPNKDGFQLQFNGIIKKFVGVINRQYLEMYFEDKDGKTIAIVKVLKSPHPVYLKNEGKTSFYIRLGNECQPLDIDTANEYVSKHFGNLK